MPWHVALDGARERRLGRLQIGTTRRGIGPAYADKATRIGIRVQDLLDPKILRQKLELAVAEKNVWLAAGLRARAVRRRGGRLDAARLRGAPRALRRRHVAARRSRAPCRRAGALRGRAGDAARPRSRDVSVRHLLEPDRGGRGGQLRDRPEPHRRGARRREGIRDARRRRARSRARSSGRTTSACRSSVSEFGTVTGRERRCGWLDLVALRFAVRVNGITSLALTKLDVLSAFAELPVCVRYRLPDDSETEDFPAHQSDFHHCRPVFEVLAGWERADRRRASGRGAGVRRVRRGRARRPRDARRHGRRARARARPRAEAGYASVARGAMGLALETAVPADGSYAHERSHDVDGGGVVIGRRARSSLEVRARPGDRAAQRFDVSLEHVRDQRDRVRARGLPDRRRSSTGTRRPSGCGRVWWSASAAATRPSRRSRRRRST